MPDLIRLEGLEVDAPIGVYDRERRLRQRLVIDVALEADLRPAAGSDRLAETLDYDRLAAVCRHVAGEHHHHLIETVAEEIARVLLTSFSIRVERVLVRVAKPGVVPGARTVAVEIERRHG